MSLLLLSRSLVINLVNLQLLSDVAETVTAFVTRDCHYYYYYYNDDDADDETNSVSDTLDLRIVFNITTLLLRTKAKTARSITPHCLILIFPALLTTRVS
jgi:hypothetical protein